MDRGLQYAESLGTTTGAAGVNVDKVTLSATGLTNDDMYLFIADCSAGETSGASFEVEVAAHIDYDIDPSSGSDFISCPMMWTDVVSGGGIGATITIDPSSDRATVKDAAIAAFKLSGLDYAESGFGSTSSTTYTALQTLTVVVSTSGKYLILATGCAIKSETTADYNVKLVHDDGTTETSYNEATMRASTASHGWPWACMVELTLAAGTHEIRIEGKVTTTGSITVQDSCIAALREELFPAVFYAESRGTTNITSVDPTFTDKATHSPITQAQQTLWLNSGLFRKVSALSQQNHQTQIDGSTTKDTDITPNLATTEYTHSGVLVTTPTAASHTHKTQGAKSTADLGQQVATDAAVAAITMKDNATVYIRGGSVLGATIL